MFIYLKKNNSVDEKYLRKSNNNLNFFSFC